MRDSFVFYRSWLEAIKNLPREVQGDVLTSIIEYGLYGETTEPLKPITKAMLEMVKPQINKNNQRYENGCRGGRPKTRTEAKPKDNQKITKAKPKDNQKGTSIQPPNNQVATEDEPNVYDNDNVNERDSLSLKKEEKEKEYYPDSFVPVTLQECYEEISRNASWAEQFVMNKRAGGYKEFTAETLHDYLDEFFRELQCRGETQKSIKDSMSHFAAWVNLKLEKNETAQKNIRINDRCSSGPSDTRGSGLKIHRYSGA